jgi:hypothetical protein
MLYSPRGLTMETSVLPGYAVRGIVFSQWTYWSSLAISALSIRYIPPGSIRTAVMLTPVLTASLSVSMAYWLYRDCDEYIRLKLLRCATTTAVIVAFCTLAYFFLELLGFPRLSMLWVNLLGWSVFNAQMLLVILRSQ